MRHCQPHALNSASRTACARGTATIASASEPAPPESISRGVASATIPPRAITIKPEEIPAESKFAKVEKRPKEFDIDMIRCIYCGLCEEVCPEQAIFLRKDYAITGTTRAEMVHHKARLYELGGVFNGLVHKWNPQK